MKKVYMILCMVVTVITLQAQTPTVRLNIKEGEVPTVIVTAFHSDYQGVVAAQWSRIPVHVIEETYEITGYDPAAQPTYYAVKIKGSNLKGEAIYDAQGKLLHSKEWITNAMLPADVTNAIMAKYPGYSFLKDQETIRGGRKEFIHFRVTIAKGKEKRVVATDETGKNLRERKVL